MRHWTDEEICTGMRDSSRRGEAFRALHRRYSPRLLGLLIRMCHGDRDRAEDLLGRALHKAYLGLARLSGECRSLGAWLYTLAARTALDELGRSDPDRACLPFQEDLLNGTPPADPAGERNPALTEAVEAVLQRLEAEQPRYRVLLEMEHIGACSREEIAAATGLPRKQISQYLKRARERFLQHARRDPLLAAYVDRGEAP